MNNQMGESDGERAMAISGALQSLHIDSLRVEVAGASVYIRGIAPCYDKKREAGELAARAAPGACIENELRVGQTASASDADVLREVAAAIRAAAPAAAERIGVEVRAGVVVLEGAARSPAERRTISAAAWSASCFAQIEDRMTLAVSGLPDADVARSLNEYVQRSLNVPPGAVVVEYRSGVARLVGRVASMSQYQAIEDLVRWHDQVNDVVNALHVVAGPTARSGAGAVL